MHCTYVSVPPCLPGELVVCAGARAPDGASSSSSSRNSRTSQRPSSSSTPEARSTPEALARARQASGPITEALSTQHAALARSEEEEAARLAAEATLDDALDPHRV